MIGKGKTKSPVSLRKAIPYGDIIRDLDRGEPLEIIDEKSSETVKWLLVHAPRLNVSGYVAERFTEWTRSPVVGPVLPVPDVEPPRPQKDKPDDSWAVAAAITVAAIFLLGVIAAFLR